MEEDKQIETEQKTKKEKDYGIDYFNLVHYNPVGEIDKKTELIIDNLTDYILINHRVTKYKLDCFNKLKSKIKFRILWKLEYQIEGVVKSLDDNFVHVTTDKDEEIIIHLDEIDCRTIFPLTYDPLKYPLRKSIPDDLRKYIFKRDNNECQLKSINCTKAATEIDHIISISKGGKTIAENLQASCLTCNREKGAK